MKCILGSENYSFISSLDNNVKNTNILVFSKSLYYLAIFMRFSSLFYSTQLVDIFSYEVPRLGVNYHFKNVFKNKKTISSLIVYNFHVLFTQNRFFIFVLTNSVGYLKNGIIDFTTSLPSITELFFSANWLEREVSELHLITFSGKKDIRNLMLQYGDSTAPFQKSFPTIGIIELFYNPIKDTLTQNPISVQL